LAETYEKLGQLDEALEVLQKRVERADASGNSKEGVMARGSLVRALYRTGRYQKAIESGRETIQLADQEDLTKSTPGLRYFIGASHMERNEPKEALPYLREAANEIARDPDKNVSMYLQTHMLLARCWLNNDNPEEAQKILQGVLEKSNDDPWFSEHKNIYREATNMLRGIESGYGQ
jgi:tetratricopeptide (TPR) repeat protein